MGEIVMLFEEYSQWVQDTDTVKAKLEGFAKNPGPGFPYEDYTTDAEAMNDGSGGTIVWIEFTGVDQKDIAEVENNYEQVEGQFKAWCEENGLLGSEVTTTEDSVTFHIAA